MTDTAGKSGSLGAWLNIVGCMLTMTFVSGLSNSGLGVMIPGWIQAFSLSQSTVMLVLVIISVLAGLFGIVVGNLGARFSPRALLAAGVVCGVAALVIGSRAPTFGILLLCLAPLSAVANAFTGPVVGISLAVRNFPRPGLAIAVVTMGMGLGAIVGPLLLATLLQHGDWRWVMQMSAIGLAVLGAVVIALFIRGGGNSPVAAESAAAPGEAASARPLRTLDVLTSPTFIGASIFELTLMALMAGTFFHLGLYFIERGWPLATAAKLMSLSSFVALAGIFASGWLVDRIPHRVLQLLCFAMIGGAVTLLAFPQSAVVVTLAILMLSAGNSILYPLIPAILAERFTGAAFHKANAMNQPVLFSSILGAFVIGLVHDNVGTYESTYKHLLVMLVLALVGLALVTFSHKRPKVATEAAA